MYTKNTTISRVHEKIMRQSLSFLYRYFVFTFFSLFANITTTPLLMKDVSIPLF